MEQITSVNNTVVKNTAKLLQKKYRDIEDKFIIEGFKSIEEAFQANLNIEYVFVLNDVCEKYKFLPNEKIILTNSIVLQKISATESAPEAIAVAKKINHKITDIKDSNKLILLEGIKDLGNLGTIIRTSVAFNIDGIILYGDCADIYNPKCVRSAVGNLWKIPIVYSKDINEIKNSFSEYQKIATLPLAKNLLKNFKINKKALIMFGSEADGLSKDLIEISTDSVKIEMKDNVESLNLAVSCAVILYSFMQK